ncbi:MAG: glycosyltransferase [Acidisphaera sp.]|nr:glycosyltransferase [Acidisphaera sp.]MBV9813055.1 glycosyltransferase [Acetobacteraceae bacterium]
MSLVRDGLALDMTASVVSRTAVFHMALDTAAAWRARTQAWRYGEDYRDAPIEDRQTLAAMKQRIMELVMGDGGIYDDRHSVFAARRKRDVRVSRTLFFDPLYVLIDELRRDDIVFVLDVSPLTNPEWHDVRACELYEVAYLRLLTSGARVLAISQHTADALWANFGLEPERVTVVPLYTRAGLQPQTGVTVPKERRFLFVGSLETRKNIAGLMLGFERSGLALRGYTLSVVGGRGHGGEAIKDLAFGIRGVELHGFAPDAELRHLYESSLAFAYPSFLEGFGVPVLESLSWGLPILTANTGAAAEVAGADAIIVDPYDIAAIAQGLCRLADMSEVEREAIAARNRARATEFSFERYIATMEQAVFRDGNTVA